MPPEDKPAVLRAIQALVEEGEERARAACSITTNYPYELVPMDVSMRYGTQGIIASMRPLHAPVPVTPAGAGGGGLPPGTPTQGGSLGGGEGEAEGPLLLQPPPPLPPQGGTERI